MSCSYMNRPGLSFAAREVGCPLDHCRGPSSHHLADPKEDCRECEAEGRCGKCGLEAHSGKTCDEEMDEAFSLSEAELEALREDPDDGEIPWLD